MPAYSSKTLPAIVAAQIAKLGLSKKPRGSSFHPVPQAWRRA